jgi:hypothetical protein
MKFGLRISLKCLLACFVACSATLGFFASKESHIRKQCSELQKLGVSLETEFDPGIFPHSIAACFPAVFCNPKRAWIHYECAGSEVTVAGETCTINTVKPKFEEIISKVEDARFTVNFSLVAKTSGFFRHSYFDIVGMFPNYGDGKVWHTPEDRYEELIARSKRNLFAVPFE